MAAMGAAEVDGGAGGGDSCGCAEFAQGVGAVGEDEEEAGDGEDGRHGEEGHAEGAL